MNSQVGLSDIIFITFWAYNFKDTYFISQNNSIIARALFVFLKMTLI